MTGIRNQSLSYTSSVLPLSYPASRKHIQSVTDSALDRSVCRELIVNNFILSGLQISDQVIPLSESLLSPTQNVVWNHSSHR